MYDPLEELDYEEGRGEGEGAAGDQKWAFTVYAYKRKTHSFMTSK